MTFFCFSHVCFAQVGGGQSYDRLPDGNLMVDTTLTILKTLTQGDIETLKSMSNFEIKSNDKIDSIKFFVTNGEISDTSMTEHFFGTESSTELEFTLDCTKYKKDLLYILSAKSDGDNGSIKNYRIELIKDTVSLSQKRAFEKFIMEGK